MSKIQTLNIKVQIINKVEKIKTEPRIHCDFYRFIWSQTKIVFVKLNLQNENRGNVLYSYSTAVDF